MGKRVKGEPVGGPTKAECRTCGWVKALEDPNDVEAYIRVHQIENERHEVKMFLPDGQAFLFDMMGLRGL